MALPRFCILGLITLVAIFLPSVAWADSKEDQSPPNIVFLLADDLGWTGLRCFGSDFYETPALDQLASRGMKFTNAYAACTVCSPTRGSIMTGLYPARIRLTDFIAGQNRPFAKLTIPDWTKRLDPKYTTIAERLKSAGYATLHVGKWHLNDRSKDAKTNIGPQEHGFDASIVKPAGTRGYFLTEKNSTNSKYLTDHLTDKAIDWIDRHQQKPFFLYFAYHTPHTPIQGRADLVEKYTKLAKPQAIHKNPTYAAMVNSLDQSVGRILAKLEELDLSKRTVVVFTSDNGGLTQRYGKLDGFTENLPLRRGKGSAYEGGVRVPTIVHWPDVTKPKSVCHEPISTIDYFATLAEIAIPNQPIDKTDGRSLVPLLRDSATTINRDLFWHYPHYHAGGDSPYSAIRSGDWRLIEFHEDGRLELYNLRSDVGETKNLVVKEPKRAKRLHQKLVDWRLQVAAQMPTRNPNYDPRRATQVRR